MTKEELEKEAEESFEQYKVTDEDYVVSPYSDDMGEKMLMYNDEYYAEETYLRFYTQAYLASAEPREKRIAELTEQNTSLLTSVENLNKTVQELEQENAELKSELSKVCGIKGCAKLTKAKDLLLKLSTCLEGHSNNNFEYELIKEAEQFLKGVEK